MLIVASFLMERSAGATSFLHDVLPGLSSKAPTSQKAGEFRKLVGTDYPYVQAPCTWPVASTMDERGREGPAVWREGWREDPLLSPGTAPAKRAKQGSFQKGRASEVEGPCGQQGRSMHFSSVYELHDTRPVGVQMWAQVGGYAAQCSEFGQLVSSLRHHQASTLLAPATGARKGTRWQVLVRRVPERSYQGPLAVQAGTHLGGHSGKCSEYRDLVPRVRPHKEIKVQAHPAGLAGACRRARWQVLGCRICWHGGESSVAVRERPHMACERKQRVEPELLVSDLRKEGATGIGATSKPRCPPWRTVLGRALQERSHQGAMEVQLRPCMASNC